jgi:hypothetical protein
MLSGARQARAKIGERLTAVHGDVDRYGHGAARWAGAVMIDHYAKSKLPGKESVLDGLRLGGGWVLNKLEQIALEAALERFGEHEKEVASEVDLLLGSSAITATCRPPITGATVFGVCGATGRRSGLSMPEAFVGGTYIGVDVGRSELFLTHPEQGKTWSVGLISYEGIVTADLAVQPLPQRGI